MSPLRSLGLGTAITKPRPNVIVRLCVGYNDSYKIGSPGNQVFADDLKIWSTISERVYIWDYVADFSDFGYVRYHNQSASSS